MNDFDDAATIARPLPADAAELAGLEATLDMLAPTVADVAATIRRPAGGESGAPTIVRPADNCPAAEDDGNAKTVVRSRPADSADAATVDVGAAAVDTGAATVDVGAATVDAGAATVAKPAAARTEAYRATVLRTAPTASYGAAAAGGKTAAGQTAAGQGGSSLSARSHSISLRTGASQISINVHPRHIAAETMSGRGAAAVPPDANSDYELQDKLGEGGMGVVYTARQSSIDRQIALKMLKGDTDDAAKAKFLQEAVVTGDLDHPNIVTIHDLGTDAGGNIFYAMKKISGRGWHQALKGLSRQENLNILLKVCDAVAFAHSRGIIHRDLKPENVMLGEFGEVIVMDWGLALAVTDNGKAERVNAGLGIAGTPAYLAPEMAAPGRWREIGPASDVYLLGAILYEILTGHRPHEGKDVRECLRNAARNVIRDSGQPRNELMDIALRAMATRPEDRFAKVQDFQAAVRGYQAHAEANLIAEKARAQLERAAANRDYEEYAGAVYRFRQARELWGGDPKMLAGQKSAVTQYAALALENGDLDLALSLVTKDEYPEYAPLKLRITDAIALRERQRRHARALRTGAIALTALVVVVSVGAAVWINAARRSATLAMKAMVAAQHRERGERAAKIAAQREAAVSKEDLRLRDELAADAWWTFDAAEAARRQQETAKRINLPVTLAVNLGAAPLPLQLIPAGEFGMGSPLEESGRLSEERLHRVKISRPFYLARTELTRAQYAALGGKLPPVPATLGLTVEERADGNLPVTGLSWDAVANDLLPRLDRFAPKGWKFALPTEAQWEWACRAGTRTAYFTGDGAAAMAKAGVSGGENRLGAAPGGKRAANAWGLCDTHGNLAEWCADAYAADFFAREKGVAVDPFCAGGAGGKRVVRGGSWANMEEHCRSAYRSYATPAGGYRFVGVRLALVPAE